MFSFQEQFSAATKNNLESQIALLTALTGKAFESVEKVIELNMSVAKAALEDSTANAKQQYMASLTQGRCEKNAKTNSQK